MTTYKYVIADRQGLHATNAMRLCREASDFNSRITLKAVKGTADCKNVLSLMSLGARQGETVELGVEGEDEQEASVYLQNLLRTIL